MTNEGTQNNAQQRGAQATAGEPVLSHLVPKSEPQENPGVSLGGGFVPGRALILRIRRSTGDIGWQLASRRIVWIVHSSGVGLLRGPKAREADQPTRARGWIAHQFWPVIVPTFG